MTKEALTLALRALGNSWTEPGNKQYEIEKEAITAIKEALAQRTWVGLTDEEIEKIWDSDVRAFPLLARAIEAKLKEKNT